MSLITTAARHTVLEFSGILKLGYPTDIETGTRIGYVFRAL